jgi:hypothetical protein
MLQAIAKVLSEHNNFLNGIQVSQVKIKLDLNLKLNPKSSSLSRSTSQLSITYRYRCFCLLACSLHLNHTYCPPSTASLYLTISFHSGNFLYCDGIAATNSIIPKKEHTYRTPPLNSRTESFKLVMHTRDRSLHPSSSSKTSRRASLQIAKTFFGLAGSMSARRQGVCRCRRIVSLPPLDRRSRIPIRKSNFYHVTHPPLPSRLIT